MRSLPDARPPLSTPTDAAEPPPEIPRVRFSVFCGTRPTAAPLSPPSPRPTPVPGRLPALPWTGRSVAGRPVRVSVTTDDYAGARPFFVARYGGRGGATRFTPYPERAAELLGLFLADVTDPAALRPAPRPAPLAWR